MTTLQFSRDYRENLRILLRAGYPPSEANSLASTIKKKFDEEERRKFREAVDEELKSLGREIGTR